MINNTSLKTFVTGATICVFSTCLYAEEYGQLKPSAPSYTPFNSGDFYVEIFGGAALASDFDADSQSLDLDTGFNLGGAIGKKLSSQFDIEFEAFYTESDLSDFNNTLSTLALNVNLIYNIPLSDRFSAYIGAGVGAVYAEAEFGRFFADDDWSVGYNAVAGVRYSLSANVDLFGEYRYSDTFDDFELLGSSAEVNNNDVSIGVRWKF